MVVSVVITGKTVNTNSSTNLQLSSTCSRCWSDIFDYQKQDEINEAIVFLLQVNPRARNWFVWD